MKRSWIRILTGCSLALLLTVLAGCNGEKDTQVSDSTVPSVSITESASAPTTDTEPEETTGYADIGDGQFTLEQDRYHAVVGHSVEIKGSFSFDEPDTVPLTITADNPDAVEASPDGTVIIKKAGDFTLTVKEEKYGTSATCRLTAVGDLQDNIIISVPIWRKCWVNEEQFNYMKEAGVDMVVAVSGIENRDYANSNHMLEEAVKTWSGGTGLRVLVHSTNQLNEHFTRLRDHQLKTLSRQFQDEPAFAGYHIIDEPYDMTAYAPNQNKLAKYDAPSISDTNFLPGGSYPSMEEYAHRMDDYCKMLDDDVNMYLSMDNYPFHEGAHTVNEDELFGNFEAIHQVGLQNHRPTAFYLQAVGGPGTRRADKAMLTYHTASALAYGFKWIKYWSWYVPDYGENPEATMATYTDSIMDHEGKPTDMYPVAKELHQRVHAIGPILVDCEAVEVYHTGRRSQSPVYTKLPADFFLQPDGQEYAIVSLLSSQTNDQQYLMIVNKNMASRAHMDFTLKGVDQLIAYDTLTGIGTEQKLTDHHLTLTLEPGDFAFFALPAGDFRRPVPVENPHNLAGKAASIKASASLSSNGYFIECAFDGFRTSENPAHAGWGFARSGAVTLTYDHTVSFNRIDLYPAGDGIMCGAQFPKSVRVSVSTKDAPDEWTVVYENTDMPRPTTEVPVIRLEQSIKADRIRFEFDEQAMSTEIAEIEIYDDDGSIPAPPKTSYEEIVESKGENYALHKKPIASGSAYESHPDAWGLLNLTDGSKLENPAEDGRGTNGWMAQGSPTIQPAGDSVWGGVDLGASYTINQVIFYSRKSGAYFLDAYDVQISEDGEHYETVYSGTNDQKGPQQIVCRFEKDRKARFVRIVGRKLRDPIEPGLGGYLMQLSEIEVFWN